MDDITISAAVAWLLAVAAGLVTLSKGWEIVRKLLHPEADVRATSEHHARLLDKDNRRITELEEETKEMREGINVLCQTQLAILNHELTGNSHDSIRTARDKLNTYLVNRR